LLLEEFKDQLVGIYHDGTTHEGEAFSVVYRAVTAELDVRVRLVRTAWLKATMDNEGISAELLDITGTIMQTGINNVLSWMHDSGGANITSYNTTLRPVFKYVYVR
jgi:hypothetical protein